VFAAKQTPTYSPEKAMRQTVTSFVLILTMVVSGTQALHSAQAQTKTDQKTQQSDKKDSQMSEKDTPQKKIEEEVLTLLAKGRQSAAEDLLAKHVETIEGINDVLDLISHHRIAEANDIIKAHSNAYLANQRLVYLHAALMRSRFEIEDAFPFFHIAVMTKKDTPFGQSAIFILSLDASKETQKHPDAVFAAMEKIADPQPNDVIFRWMIAVECRSYSRNERGAAQYKKILEKWNPGPVLVHQTYANLLDELNRFDQALVERRKTVEMEQAGWSYDGLGNTLDNLGRFDEGSKAHEEACKLDPNDGRHLGNWARNAMLRKKYDEAIEKCERATQLDPTYLNAWLYWGEALEGKGKKTEALEKYQHIVRVAPNTIWIKPFIERLEKELSKEPQTIKPEPSRRSLPKDVNDLL
jgi:tetratricopeptide (TPR) repeat protein